VVRFVSRRGTDVILCVNCGSSSVKCAVYRVGATGEERLATASTDGPGLESLDSTLAELGFDDELTAAGHRLVHGGPYHYQPARVDETLLAELRAAVPFAPVHLPVALAAIGALSRRHPELPQVACFDTAFHQTMPESAWHLPLPAELTDLGIRRYGFHGLSYEYVVGVLGPTVLGRAVLAHLGNGASLAAIRDGRSVHTTMGFTPTGGVVMGCRSGDLDPGVLVYAARELGYDAERLERLVDHESGLLALSGTSSDMQTLVQRREGGDHRATLAIDVFCTRIRMQIRAYAALLGGLDTIVFTGGIGAHAASIRAKSCRGLDHLGVTVDERSNAANAPVISPDPAPVTVRVVETDEDLMIARHTHTLLATEAQPPLDPS